MSNHNSPQKCINVSVIGISGSGHVKGVSGVGKSLLCNRFVRPTADDLYLEHSSVLSQTDFCGSPVINSDHWLYWGERLIRDKESTCNIRVIEQTEFVDDVTFEPIAGSSYDEYAIRCTRVALTSRDKLMYICKEQLGLEEEFPQKLLTGSSISVDVFVLVCDVSRPLTNEEQLLAILANISRSKKPCVVALSKFDDLNDNALKKVQTIIAKKEWRNVHHPAIEVSALRDVNVDDVFRTAVSLCFKPFKHRRNALQPYYEAALLVEQRNILIRKSFSNLLRQLIPLNHVTKKCRTWQSLVRQLEGHREFINYITIYGTTAAYRVYEQYMREVSDCLITKNLIGLLPKLKTIFNVFLNSRDVLSLEWTISRDLIYMHSLFDEYFYPIGEIDIMASRENNYEKLPAEILKLPEAKLSYEDYREELKNKIRNETMEASFLNEITETSLGSFDDPLKSHSKFMESYSTYNQPPPNSQKVFHDRYLHSVVQSATFDFIECLLENVSHLIMAIDKNCLSLIAENIGMDERYRNISNFKKVRERVIYSMVQLYKYPSSVNCKTSLQCIDSFIKYQLKNFFSRINDVSVVDLIEATVVGTSKISNIFIQNINRFLKDYSFRSSLEFTCIRFSADESAINNSKNSTIVYLIDSAEQFNSIIKEFYYPPILITIDCADLQRKAANISAAIGATFLDFPVNNIYDDEKLKTVCESICSSQLSRRRQDVCLQFTIFCDDSDQLDLIFSSVFSSKDIRLVVHPNFTSGEFIPINVKIKEQFYRCKLSFCSYHSWLAKCNLNRINSIQAHVLFYTIRRASSLAHARFAIQRLLEQEKVNGESRRRPNILLVAILEEQSIQVTELLYEGIELSASTGVRFAAIGRNSTDLSQKIIEIIEEEMREKVKIEQNSKNIERLLLNNRHKTLHLNRLKLSGRFRKNYEEEEKETINGIAKQTEISNTGNLVAAPLATPEAVEIASEYSLVEDALSCDEGIYETIDIRGKQTITDGAESRRYATKEDTSGCVTLSTVQHSHSAESIAELLNNKKRGSRRFVRKVATSFRFRGKEKNDENLTSPRSLPQSPRCEHKTRLISSTNLSTEKVSNAFFWLQPRSPKRSQKEKNNYEVNSSSMSSSASTTSGVIEAEDTLESLCRVSFTGIPSYVEKCIEFIENNGGMELEGIYRIPGNQAHLAEVEQRYLKTREFDVSGIDTPVHVAATALKNFFNCLPLPLIPLRAHNEIMNSVVQLKGCEQASKLREIFEHIEEPRKRVLKYLTNHLEKIASSPKTVMNVKNLSKVWFPTLFRPEFNSYEALSTGMINYQLAMESILTNHSHILD